MAYQMFPIFVCSSYAPQLQFVNGKMVIDTESLAIKRSAMATDIPAEAMEIVEETSMSRVVNSQSYGKKSKSQRWSAEETEKFYNVCMDCLCEPSDLPFTYGICFCLTF